MENMVSLDLGFKNTVFCYSANFSTSKKQHMKIFLLLFDTLLFLRTKFC